MYEGIRNSKVENARKKVHSEVTTYKLSPQELAKYTEGENRIKLTKEIYEQAKKKNMSDVAILKEYRVHQFRLKELKAEWYPKAQIVEEGVVEELVKRDDLAAKKGLTKELFIERKEKGESDITIGKAFNLFSVDIGRLRESWGLQGKKTKTFVEEAEARAKVEDAEPKERMAELTNVAIAEEPVVHTPAKEKVPADVQPESDVDVPVMVPLEVLETVQESNRLLRSQIADLQDLNEELEEKSLKADDLFFEHGELKEKHEKLQEDYDALSEGAESLTQKLKETTDDNLKVWNRNKELQGVIDQQSERNKKQVANEHDEHRYEQLYQVTAKALLLHLPK